LRNRQGNREHDRGRVEHRAVVHVVLLGEMRGGGVDHRGEQRRAAAARDQDFTRAVLRPHLPREGLDDLHRAAGLAGQRRAEPVEEQVFGAPQHGLRDVFETQVGGEGGQFLAGVIIH
jgi:hypothetical protein